MNIKKTALACALAFGSVAFAATIEDDAMKGLEVDDQVSLVDTLNASLKNFRPSSIDVRNATAYKLNRDAVKAVSRVDRKRVLAEVFATAPDYALPAIADGFAAEVFNRKSAGFSKNDDAFQNFALSAMLSVYRRCRGDNNIDQSNQRRIAYAVIMFLKASEGDPADLQDQLVAFLPDTIRDVAVDEWIPAAMGNDKDKKGDYRPIMNAASNDVEVAKSEIRREYREQELLFPSSEQQHTLVRHKMDIDKSVTLRPPTFAEPFASGIGTGGTSAGGGGGAGSLPQAWTSEQGDPIVPHVNPHRRDPTPYDGQGY